MKQEKIIGTLLIAGAVGVFIPYLILSITFNYPAILRKDAGSILTQFHAGGASLVFTWLVFGLFGLPLIIAYSLIGQQLEKQLPFVRWVTTIGIISGIVQIIGLLRWVFVVPVLATDFVHAKSDATKEAIIVSFKLIHQFAGVLLGEHLGQLFTIIWTIMITSAFARLKLFPKWTIWLGYVLSSIYLLAQTELFATVIPNFPVVGFAGFLGSTLWLLWLITIGLMMIKKSFDNVGT